MLSLPPAFVLSQDQTLKLRIQSRLITFVLNRRELTRVQPQGPNPVFSYQNVTVCVSFMRNPKASPRRRRPRFSFFSSSIVKKPTTLKGRHKTTHPTNQARKSISVSANFLRFSFLNQSAARLVGAALSFGEAAYTATPFCRQQPFVKKLSFFLRH